MILQCVNKPYHDIVSNCDGDSGKRNMSGKLVGGGGGRLGVVASRDIAILGARW